MARLWPLLAECGIGRQHHQAQRPVVGHVAAVGEDMDAAEHAAGKTALHALADGGNTSSLSWKRRLRSSISRRRLGRVSNQKRLLALVEVVQPVAEPAERVLVQPDLLAGLNAAEQDALELEAAHQSGSSVLGALPRKIVRATRRQACTLPKRGLLVLELGRLGPLAVDVALDHRVPAGGR